MHLYFNKLLGLENIENESDSDTDSFIYSDVSADTFVTLSDVDCDERHIIELSNDSNYERANLGKYIFYNLFSKIR